MRDVRDEEIESYRALCEQVARPLVGQANAELDDLVQEGQIHVWLRLAHNRVPAAQFIKYRMQNYVRFLQRQTRESASYDEMVHDNEDWLIA